MTVPVVYLVHLPSHELGMLLPFHSFSMLGRLQPHHIVLIRLGELHRDPRN